MVVKIAITGNIASGKSKVEKFISDYGYNVYDTDIIAHTKLNEINDFFGYDVFTDGKIDRNKLGTLVFSNADLKSKLEQIIHPKVKEEILNIFNKHKTDKFVFISVPLLYESGFNSLFDKVILIIIDEDIQLKRLMIRNNFSKEDAIIRIKSQMPQELKIEKADYVISNNLSEEELKADINKLLKDINNIF